MWCCNYMADVGEHVICHVLEFLDDPFWLYTWDCAKPASVDAFKQSIHHMTCFHRMVCLLRSC